MSKEIIHNIQGDFNVYADSSQLKFIPSLFRVQAVSLFLAFVCWQGHGVYRSVRLYLPALCNWLGTMMLLLRRTFVGSVTIFDNVRQFILSFSKGGKIAWNITSLA